MDKMMICPKAEECKVNCIAHKEPHESFWECDVTSKVCPACIPCKPEPEECKKCPANGNPVCDKIKNLPDKPQYKLVLLPEKETLEQLVLEIRQHLLNTEFGLEPFMLPLELDFKTIYADKIIASTKEVDLDELTQHIRSSVQNTISGIYTPEHIKQAIEDYIGRV